MIAHPINTAKGIGNAVLHPIDTGKAIYTDIKTKLNTSEGQGQIVGDILAGVATGGIVKAVSKTATVAKLVNKLSKVKKVVSGKIAKIIPDKVATQIKKIKGKDGVDLDLKYKENWTDVQKTAANKKAKALTDADTYVNKNPKRTGKAQVEFRKKNDLSPNVDADHIQNLQLNGKDILKNIQGLDSSVNRSIGKQIQQKIKGLPDGTKVNKVNISD